LKVARNIVLSSTFEQLRGDGDSREILDAGDRHVVSEASTAGLPAAWGQSTRAARLGELAGITPRCGMVFDV
jgi:hypothetical protein